MKNFTTLVLLILTSQVSFAALPPKFQNEKDLEVMIKFVKKHESVISSLISIDFKKHIVYFGDDCKAIFGRKHTKKAKDWVGPSDPLVFKKSTCNLGD